MLASQACTKIALKNPKFKISIFTSFFFKNQYTLKKWLKVCAFNPQYQIFHWKLLKLDFAIFEQKVHPLRILWANVLISFWVPHSYHTAIKSTDIQKMILQPFRSVETDAFLYSSHWNPIRTRWDRAREKKIQIFYLWMCLLTMYFEPLFEGFWIYAI